MQLGPSLYLLQECAWEVTFESKAGDVASLEVASDRVISQLMKS